LRLWPTLKSLKCIIYIALQYFIELIFNIFKIYNKNNFLQYIA